MRTSTTHIRPLLGPFPAALCAGAILCAVAGCSGPYDAALKDQSLAGDARLALRVREMVECADHAVRSLDAAQECYAGEAGDSSRSSNRLPALVNKAEADAFEFSRRVLSVEDVASGALSEAAGDLDRLRTSMASCNDALSEAVRLLGTPSDAGDGVSADVDGAIQGVHERVEAVKRDAQALMGH